MIYAYNAALYCEDCGSDIIDHLEGLEDTGDSGDYPQGFSGHEEADCPQHCDACGVFLQNDLTSEGYEYVKERVREAVAKGKATDVLLEWICFYDFTLKDLFR